MEQRTRVFLAEAVGTSILMLGGVGSAVLAGGDIGFLGVALAFGLSLLVIAAVFGSVSGAHVNPAVTLGLYLAGKTSGRDLPVYFSAQFVGAVLGGALVLAVASGLDGFAASDGFAANGYGALSPGGYGLLAVFAAELVFTAVFVLAVLATTRSGFAAGLGPVTAGLGLGLVHLVTIPVSNTSVNPARSFGAALFQGGEALTQLWVFFVAPLGGAMLAALVWRVLRFELPASAAGVQAPSGQAPS